MIGGVTRHMLSHPPGISHLHVNRALDGHLWDLHYVSILERCLSYRESNKGGKERQGPTLGVSFRGVRLIDGQIKGVKKGRNQL